MPATYLIHKQSHASYPGGFKKVNGRMNNSPAYNHAYYEDNKDKWPKYPSQMPTAVRNRLAQVNAKKESGTSSTKRLMGNGAPSSVNSSGFKGTTSNKPYTPSASWKARMTAAGKRYEARKAEEARKAAAEAAAKAAKASSKSGKKSGSGKSKKSDAEKQAENEAKEKAEKKAAKEAEAAKKKKKKRRPQRKKKAKESAASETKTKAETAKEEKKDPIDEDETLSEREKKMYKGIRNILEKSGQSMATYYANKGFDSIFAQYFPGDIDPDEKAAIKKKFMKYYKLEHGDASIGNYYGVVFSKAEIKHHGILGQKWGKKNGPPYPLDAEDHSQREKKAGWRKSLDKGSNSESKKKMLKIGAAVAVTGLAAYGAYKLSGKAKLVKDIQIVDPDRLLPRSDISYNLKHAIAGVNTANEPNHCNQNAVAACLRYLGADVDTKPGVFSQTRGSVVDKCFKGMSENKIKEPNKTFKTVDEVSDFIIRRLHAEDGSCGVVSGDLKGLNSGHAIMWCMEEGKIKYADPWARTPNGHKVVEDASFYFGNAFNGNHMTFSRIDNLEINPEGFNEYFKYAK